MADSVFGPADRWPDEDLVAVSEPRLTAQVLVDAYRHGVFPMPIRGGLMGWFSPVKRAILPLDGLRVSRSLRKMVKRYEIRLDTDFDQVLQRCADPARPGRWIDNQITAAYRELHLCGVVHTVEAWTQQGELAGGLYGVSIGGLFAGESMFHDANVGRDASKVALVYLVEMLARQPTARHRIVDMQWLTPHLASLGGVEVARSQYLRRLRRAQKLDPCRWEPLMEGPGS